MRVPKLMEVWFVGDYDFTGTSDVSLLVRLDSGFLPTDNWARATLIDGVWHATVHGTPYSVPDHLAQALLEGDSNAVVPWSSDEISVPDDIEVWFINSYSDSDVRRVKMLVRVAGHGFLETENWVRAKFDPATGAYVGVVGKETYSVPSETAREMFADDQEAPAMVWYSDVPHRTPAVEPVGVTLEELFKEES